MGPAASKNHRVKKCRERLRAQLLPSGVSGYSLMLSKMKCKKKNKMWLCVFTYMSGEEFAIFVLHCPVLSKHVVKLVDHWKRRCRDA